MSTETKDELEYPGDTRLFNLAIWAGNFGWLYLLFGIAQTALSLINMFRSGLVSAVSMEFDLLQSFMFFLSNLAPLFQVIAIWFFLQALKHFLFLMIDVKEGLGTRSAGE